MLSQQLCHLLTGMLLPARPTIGIVREQNMEFIQRHPLVVGKWILLGFHQFD